MTQMSSTLHYHLIYQFSDTPKDHARLLQYYRKKCPGAKHSGETFMWMQSATEGTRLEIYSGGDTCSPQTTGCSLACEW